VHCVEKKMLQLLRICGAREEATEYVEEVSRDAEESRGS